MESLRFAAGMFRHLNGGNFICRSAVSEDQRRWYDVLKDNWEDYRELWKNATGQVLVRGNEYFYFMRSFNGDRLSLNDLRDRYVSYCQVIAILFELDQSLEVGRKLTRSWLLSVLDLSVKAQDLCKVKFKSNDKNEWITELLKTLVGMQIVAEVFDPVNNEMTYPVLEPLRYYLDFIEKIQSLTGDDYEEGDDPDDGSTLFDTDSLDGE